MINEPEPHKEFCDLITFHTFHTKLEGSLKRQLQTEIIRLQEHERTMLKEFNQLKKKKKQKHIFQALTHTRVDSIQKTNRYIETT